MAFSPDGKTLASASWDGTVRLWDTVTHRPLRVLSGHTNFVNSVAFSPDGGTVASVADDATVRVWDVRTGRELGRPLQLQRGYHVNDVAFGRDGSMLASASDYGRVRLWRNLLAHTVADFRAQVCDLVVGDLTKDELAQHAPGLRHRRLCPS